MIKIVKTSNPDAAIALMPLYVETEKADRKILAERLFERMCKEPEETLVLGMTENDSLVGFGVVYSNGNVATVWQTKVLPSIDSRWTAILFGLMIGWAKKKGFKKITAETQRNPKAWQKRYGFDVADNGTIYKEI